ncbi:MAG: Crp/Fnr family transcriptional regulator [Planctomycetes bacterium]|nr:Crp/Fnr family transcriptional regulator [Planctomycetota bacterium]
MPAADLELVAGFSHVESYEAGDTIFQSGAPADHFYVVAKGAVRIEHPPTHGKDHVVNIFRGHDVFGVASALHLGRYPVNGTVHTNHTQVIAIQTEGFRALLRKDPPIAEAVIAGLSQRLFSLIQRVDEMTGDAAARVARHILARPTIKSEGDPAIQVEGTKRDLAVWLDITPETLSRVLRRWRDHNLVEVKGRRITILDVDALEAEAEGRHDHSMESM